MPLDHSLFATNPLRIMIVDDSAVIRGFLTRALEADPEMTIVASATNGVMALQLVQKYDVEIVILDIEMPQMDGLTALPELLRLKPGIRVIIASTLTSHNAAISIKALSLGASDYIEKPAARQDTRNIDRFNAELIKKIKALGAALRKKGQMHAPTPARAAVTTAKPTPRLTLAGASPTSNISAIAVACSTGGPQALATFFEGLRGAFMHIPIFVTQHMPPTFTTFLADHIGKVSQRTCKEGQEREKVLPGIIYIAPGDFHMVAKREDQNVVLHTLQTPPENFCRPSADPMLTSLAEVYGKHIATVVLTGMGQDGLKGAKIIREHEGTVIAQDEATSVVWGMPGAVAAEGLCRAILPLVEIAPYMIQNFRER